MDPLVVLDMFMAIGALVVGVWAFKNGDMARAVGAAVVFGLLAGIVWIRVGANDVLLAEAVIGAVLCLALLGVVMLRLTSRRPAAKPADERVHSSERKHHTNPTDIPVTR